MQVFSTLDQTNTSTPMVFPIHISNAEPYLLSFIAYSTSFIIKMYFCIAIKAVMKIYRVTNNFLWKQFAMFVVVKQLVKFPLGTSIRIDSIYC